MADKSFLTATVYLRNLRLFCELNDMNPKALLKVAETKEFRGSFIDFVRRMES